MRIKESIYGFTVLTPDSDDYLIYSINRNTYHKKVCLGKNDSVDNYRQVEKSLVEEVNAKSSNNDLLDRLEKQEATIAKLSKQVNDLLKLVNKNK